MIFTESGIQLDFPDGHSFRFEDLVNYRDLSGYSFKEMDACWLDKENNIFYLVELKDFTEANLTEQIHQNKKIYELVKKSIDSLVMILSILLKTKKGIRLENELSFNIPKGSKLFFISILHIKDSQRDYLNFIRDKYKIEFMAYAKLFDLKHTIISRNKAIERFEWVKAP